MATYKQIEQAAKNQERRILCDLAGINDGCLTGKHGPCPSCGGVDRFRFNAALGSPFCNVCFAGGPGKTGLVDAVAHFRGVPKKQAKDMIEAYLGLGAGGNGKPKPPAGNGAAKGNGATVPAPQPTPSCEPAATDGESSPSQPSDGKLIIPPELKRGLHDVDKAAGEEFRQRYATAKGVSVEAVKRAGAIPARYYPNPESNSCFEVLVFFGFHLGNPHEVKAVVLARADGKAFFGKAKTLLMKGSKSSWICTTPDTPIETANSVATPGGVSDAVGAAEVSPEGMCVLTPACGENSIEPSLGPAVKGKEVFTLLDADKTGEAGTRKIVDLVSSSASSIRKVDIASACCKIGNGAKDLRDILRASSNKQETFDKLIADAEEIEPTSKTVRIPHPNGEISVDVPLDCELVHEGDGAGSPGSNFPSWAFDVPGVLHELVTFMLDQCHVIQMDFFLAAAIVCVGAIIGNRVSDASGARTNLFWFLTGRSGCGKDLPRRVIRRVMAQAGLLSMLCVGAPKSAAGLLRSMKESPALFLVIDEVGLQFRHLNDPRRRSDVIDELIRQATTGFGVIDSGAYSDSTKNFRVEDPHLTVLGMTTNESLCSGLQPENVFDGLLGRCLTAKEAPTYEIGPGVESDVPLHLSDSLKELSEMEHRVVPYSDEAQALLLERRERHRKLMNDRNADPGWQALSARTIELGARLALIHHVSLNQGNGGTLAHASLEWGIGLAEHSAKNMLRLVRTWMSDGRFDADQKELLRFVDSKNGVVTQSEVTRKLQKHAPKDREQILLNVLETHQLFKGSQPGKGSRTVVVYVRPDVIARELEF